MSWVSLGRSRRPLDQSSERRLSRCPILCGVALPHPWRPTGSKRVFESGQAHVFEVSRPDDPAHYALKRLKNPRREGRFYREIETMRALGAMGVSLIPPVIDSGRDQNDRPYFVMPWYPEGSLEAVVENGGVQDPVVGVETLLAVAQALEAVHQAGWAHRDLKPANVLLDSGRPLLADLGLTMSVEAAVEERFTGSQEAIGSRLYIAPENESGFNQDQDQRPADFYAFAKVGWALLAGQAPPARERQVEPGSRLVDRLPEPKLAELDALFKLLLRTDPRARLQAWGPVIAELHEVIERLKAKTPPAPDVGSIEDRASEAARRYAESSPGLTARLQQERAEKHSQRFAEIRLALQLGLGTVSDRYDELMRASQGSMQLAVAQGHPPLREILALGVLRDAGVQTDLADGLAASLNEGAHLVVMAPIHAPPPPAVYLAGYVYVDTRAEAVWLVRVPLVQSVSPRGIHLIDPLRKRFFEAVGPLPLESDTAAERARSFGYGIGLAGLELAAAYLQHVADELDLLEPATWEAHPADS